MFGPQYMLNSYEYINHCWGRFWVKFCLNKTVPLMKTTAIKEIRVACAFFNLIWVSLR